jgi:SAM-dependent methyltransferase
MVGMHTIQQNGVPNNTSPQSVPPPTYADLRLSKQHELFCAQDWYQKVLEHHISRLNIIPKCCYLDVGSGTGCATSLLAERLKPGGIIIGIEPSEGLVRCASQNAEGDPCLKYKIGRAEEITSIGRDHEVEGVVSFNTVHLLSSRERFYQDVRSLLPNGGTLSFCTGYHSRGMSEPDRENILQALFNAYTTGLQMVRTLMPHSIRASAHTTSRTQNLELSRTEYELKRSGFASVHIDLQPITMPAASFAEFLTLPGSQLLPASIPLEQQKKVILEALQERGIAEVSRAWLHVYAQ